MKGLIWRLPTDRSPELASFFFVTMLGRGNFYPQKEGHEDQFSYEKQVLKPLFFTGKIHVENPGFETMFSYRDF